MAVVKGIKEKVHLPLYDAITFGTNGNVADSISKSGNVIKFFVNIQEKTKLETNQQESGVLSHYNTFEARALRIVLEPPMSSDQELNQEKEKLKDANTKEVILEAGKKGIDLALALKRNEEFLANFIYNSVTSFFVGEKVMIQAPTWFFPSGAGPSNDNGVTSGAPTPEATFRFAEPVKISAQQNFRVEIEFPRGANILGDTKGPSKIWAIVDGFMTRDVQ